MSEKTILYLLESQLLMPTARWQQILDAVIPIMAILEVGTINLGSHLDQWFLNFLKPGTGTIVMSLFTDFIHFKHFYSALQIEYSGALLIPVWLNRKVFR